MKTIGLSKKLVSKIFRADDNKVVGDGNSRANKTIINSSKNLTYMPNLRAIKKPNFLTLHAKKTFNYLQLAFIKAPIF